MNFQEEIIIKLFNPRASEWYSKDQSTNKTLLAQRNSKAKLQTETFEPYC